MLRADVGVERRDFEVAVRLEVASGRCLALAGPSGAGKSTILRAIAGLLRPDRGRIELGTSIWFDAAARLDVPAERRRCGYLFQDYALFPHLSAWRNVAFGLGHVPRAERRARARALLDSLGVGELAEASPRMLSGGERQRVALARALGRDPDLLLLDEPLAALDSRTARSAGRELSELLARAGTPAILVTHDFSEAATLADEIAVIDRGEVVQRGTPAELSARPASAFVADYAGAAVLTGVATPAADGLTRVAVDGGGTIASTDMISGHVAAAVFPWEVSLEPLEERGGGSALNRLEAQVVSTTVVGNRVRVGLACPQALAAEVTTASAERLGLEPKRRVAATWKATATRLVAI